MNLRRLLLCVLATLLLCSVFDASAKDPALRVMTYNIRYDNPADSLNNWKYRKDFVANMIRYHEADIVGIQEGLISQVHELAALLPGYAWCGKGRDDGKEAGEFSAIFYDSSKFALQNGNTFWLSPTPEKPSMGWDAALNRIVTWAQLKEKQSGREFFVFNTHFDHQGVKAREESARLLREHIGRIAPGKPVIVTGDFNSSEQEAPYAVLTAKGSGQVQLKDAFAASAMPHHGPLKTYSGFDVRQGIIGERIDFVFVSEGIRVLKHATLSDFKSDERFPSDHLPVLAELVLP